MPLKLPAPMKARFYIGGQRVGVQDGLHQIGAGIGTFMARTLRSPNAEACSHFIVKSQRLAILRDDGGVGQVSLAPPRLFHRLIRVASKQC
jgi:hypothetical protein